MRNKIFFPLAVAILICSAILSAQTPKEALLALSKRDHTLAIVDPSTLKVLAKVPIGNDPHEVIASTDGTTAYVSNYGFGTFNTLAVVDLASQKPLPAVDLGALRGPHGLAFAGGKVWFTAEAAKAIGSYDPATQKVDWILGTGQNRTHMIFVSPDLKHIVTTNVSSGTVTIIEKTPPRAPGPPPGMPQGAQPRPPQGPPPGPPGGDWDETVVRVGNGSEGFDVSPDSKEIWVANSQEGTISVIDYASKKVVDTIAANARGANRLKFTPDGKLAFVSTLSGGELIILDAGTHKELKRLTLGRGAAGILMQPYGSRAFVACSPDNNIAVIDLKSLEVVSRFEVGQEPDGLAWSARQ
ncbi:MAG: cytochrome D1 domain-containing protein [Candidatus Sulfotelmatobacter sp.]